MTLPQTVLLALVQGVTEFLPVSSSGHLILFQRLLGINQSLVVFDIMLHLGTLLSLLIYFRNEISQLLLGLLRRRSVSYQLFFRLILASLPAFVTGFFLQKNLEAVFNSTNLLGLSFFITALLLFLTAGIGKAEKSMEQISPKSALFIGLFQALAVLPGVSRSGSTIAAGLFRGLKSRAAFIFSFYLAIPAILGAVSLSIWDLIQQENSYPLLNQSLAGLVISSLAGYLALSVLEKSLKQAKFFYFGFYCLAVGLLTTLVL